MKATLNRFLFETQAFDSGALGVLASVVHRCTQAGPYAAVVRRHGREVGTVSWQVSDDMPDMQLSIDLSGVRGRARGPEGCGCDGPSPSPPTLRTGGYVLFHASSGVGGFSVSAGPENEKAEHVLDSERLGEGDLFALSLLEPAIYSVRNVLGDARGSLSVTFSAERARSIAAQQAQHVEAFADRFEPNEVALASGQGLVFRIHEPARIVVRRERPRHEDGPRGRRGPVRIERRRPPAPPEGGGGDRAAEGAVSDGELAHLRNIQRDVAYTVQPGDAPIVVGELRHLLALGLIRRREAHQGVRNFVVADGKERKIAAWFNLTRRGVEYLAGRAEPA
jgi:hypothetical protein